MKYRKYFVSNSSSSSFIINKKDLPDQDLIILIKNHFKIMSKIVDLTTHDEWFIKETKDEICGSTGMDNLDIGYYLECILKIPKEVIKWSRSEII